jgi:phosphoserine phosphatase
MPSSEVLLTLACHLDAGDAPGLARGAPGLVRQPWILEGRRWLVVEQAAAPDAQEELVRYLDAASAQARVDWAITPVEGRRKRLLVSDMDSTIIGQECIDELADFAGRKTEVSAITERAMRGELDFEGALSERVRMLAHLPLPILETCFRERVRLNPGARTLVATMKAHGGRCVLVSGGFGFFTSRVAAAAGFDADYANTLLDDGERLTGEVARPILGREAKLETLKREAARLGASPEDAIALGDGANDLDMICAAGLGIAYRAKPLVAARTAARIVHTDLAAALFFQGYREADLVEAEPAPI